MLNLKCIGDVHGKTVTCAWLPLLTLAFLPFAANADTPADDLVFVPTAFDTNQMFGDNSMPTQDRDYKDLMTRNALQALSPASAGRMQQEGKIRDYMLRIYDVENAAGPFAMELTEVLHSLGNLYLEQGMYDEALESFAREEHINRVHHGLYSETLLPAVKSQIAVLDISGRKDEADDKQRYQLHLMERCYGRADERLLPDLVAYAEWNMTRFHDIIRHEFSGMSLLSFNEGATTEQAYRETAFENLDLAAEYFARAASLLVANKKFGDPALYQLENRLVEVAFFQASRREMLRNADDYQNALNLRETMYENGPYARLARDSFHYGVASYERQLAYITSDPQGSMARYISTLMAMGDWYVLFGKNGPGYTKYREARDLLATLNVTDSSVDRVLRPDVPVSIPTFTATAHSVDAVEQKGAVLAPYSGYIDVAFQINRNGDARNVEVLSTSGNTDADVERKLVRTLMRSRFRPRFDDVDLARDDSVALRYYYAYQTPSS